MFKFLRFLRVFLDFDKEKDLSNITKEKLNIAKRNATYSVSSRLKNICFEEPIDKNGYVEYIDGFKIRNLTTSLLEKERVSIFKVKSSKDIVIDIHDHKSQSQTILVNKGKLKILDKNINVLPNNSYFVKKRVSHEIKYLAGTEATIIYLPNLDKIK